MATEVVTAMEECYLRVMSPILHIESDSGLALTFADCTMTVVFKENRQNPYSKIIDMGRLASFYVSTWWTHGSKQIPICYFFEEITG